MSSRPAAAPAAAPSPAQLFAVLAIALIAISTSGPLIVACGMAAPALGFWRVTLAGAAQLAIASALEPSARRALRRDDRVRLLAAGTSLGLHFLLFFLSLGLTSVASSTVLVTTNPLWVALGARAFLGERTTRATWAAIVLGITGAAVLAAGDAAPAAGADAWSRRALAGDALALAGALAGSGALLFGRSLRARVPALTYSGTVSLAAAPILLLAGLVSGASFAPATGAQLALLLAIAAVPHLVGNTAIYWALGWLPAPRVALLILGEPVGASLLAWALLDQRPGARTIGGAALVLVAVALSSCRTPGAEA